MILFSKLKITLQNLILTLQCRSLSKKLNLNNFLRIVRMCFARNLPKQRSDGVSGV